MHPLEQRVAATQQLLDDWKDRPFDWDGAHCARMVSDHLRRMGYTPPLAKAGPFRTALGAQRALARLGATSLADVLDGMGLPRIAPAAALVGDIVELAGEPPFGSLTVVLGDGRVLGAHQDAEGFVVLHPKAYIGAWRTIPI